MSFPNNVVNSKGGLLDAQGETLFLFRLFEALQARMGESFSRYTFVVHRRVFGESAGKPIQLDPGGPDRILILLADEREAFPVEEFSSYRAIFRSYGHPPGGGSGVHSFPVGYLNAAGQAEGLPFDERPDKVFFSGYLNRNRLDLYKQFRPVAWLPRRNLRSRYVKELARRAVERICPERKFDEVMPGVRLEFTEWFGKGLPPDEYARVLAGTQIALCPPGFISNETIRHWEAMRLGCVVISAPLPPNRFYRGSPIIEIQDWSMLRPVLADLLADPEELRIRHEATVSWWRNMCSERAVTEYMAKIIEPQQ